jgi:hypothetical protein
VPAALDSLATVYGVEEILMSAEAIAST